jgi:hypothetical protein
MNAIFLTLSCQIINALSSVDPKDNAILYSRTQCDLPFSQQRLLGLVFFFKMLLKREISVSIVQTS